nr:extracellular solute-binding protein [Limoniibacter endophyticus]
MHGEPALPADFTHFPYANPDAPKGGMIRYCVIGSYDNLNPFILKSFRTTARGVIDVIFGNLVFESLMIRSADEPFTLYGLLAQSVEISDDRKVMTFNINPDARFSNGDAVRPEDVKFTFELYAKKGRPPYSTRMNSIEAIEISGPHTVKFIFKESADREIPLIVAMTPILSQKSIDVETFDQTTLKPMIGSGAYTVKEVRPGERITFARNPDYWGRDIPAMRGLFNYDEIVIDYFLNTNSMYEAFKKGLCAIYEETDPVKRQRAIDFPAFAEGKVVAEKFKNGIPPVPRGFLFNTRRPVFKDVRVRRALAKLYDFDWANRNLFGGQMKRTGSYFQGAELSALGVVASAGERSLLQPFAQAVTPDILDGSYRPNEGDAAVSGRKAYREALELLNQAGFELRDGRMVDANGNPFTFEILAASDLEARLAAIYQRSLARLGIVVRIRMLDDSQMQQRKQRFEFDMVYASLGFSGTLSPGTEQISRWGSEAAKTEGSFNLSGASSPAIDAAIDAMLNARSEDAYIDAVRSLDRLLISGAYIVLSQYDDQQWLAYWANYQHPEKTPLTGYYLPAWWQKPAK